MSTIDFELVTGDPNLDFFTQNPQLEFFSFIELIKNKHKKEKANDILWSLYLVEDPKSKIYYGLQYDERIEKVEKKYNISYGEDCAPYKDAYINAAMGPHERNYKRLNDKFQKMIIALDSCEIDEAADFFAKLQTMYKGLDVVESKCVAEAAEFKNKYKGDREPGGLFKKRN